MRTGRSLTVCCSLHPGGVCLVRGEGVLPAGGVCAWSRGGVLPTGGMPGPGGYLPGPGGFSGDPPVNRITDTCKNIILATTLLRLVIICKICNYTVVNVRESKRLGQYGWYQIEGARGERLLVTVKAYWHWPSDVSTVSLIMLLHGCVYATTNPWIYLAAASSADFMCSSD